MNSKELGEKIKEARLARKMTQSEVVGDFITRNMLSQIESGTATPSVKTLEYLSRTLKIPLYQLLPDEQEDALLTLEKAKTLLKNGEYEKVMEMEPEHPALLADEFAAIFSQACLNRARNSLTSEAYMDAMLFSQKAIEYSEKGIYTNPTIKSESILILNQAVKKIKLDL